MNILLLLCWHLNTFFCCNPVTCNLNDPPVLMEIPVNKAPSKQVCVKIIGSDVYLSAKLDKDTDILYWFKRCMFNELFTFYRVGLVPNKDQLPTFSPDIAPYIILNLAFSDNIGPFNITGYGWSGGNHPYIDGISKTAHNVSYQIYTDGKELQKDTLVMADEVRMKVVNNIMNPTLPTKEGEMTQLKDVLCTETVDYSIKENNIQVSVSHLFRNIEPVEVQMYYGMQSMFEGETHTLTANGKYVDWTPQIDVTTFLKKEFPTFRRFIEKSPEAYQASYLLDAGLGNHSGIEDKDIIFIGNSNGKTYHKLIANKRYEVGDSVFWKGVYTWFKLPIADDNDILCYEGIIDGKDAVFIDCKRSINRKLLLPNKYLKRAFTVIEKSASVSICNQKITQDGVRVLSHSPGSCVIVF